jgi:hypothetical protein
MKPDLHRLVLGASGGVWALDADLDLGLGSVRPVNCYRAFHEFGEDEHTSRSFRGAGYRLLRLRKIRHRRSESQRQRQEKSCPFHHHSNARLLLLVLTPNCLAMS